LNIKRSLKRLKRDLQFLRVEMAQLKRQAETGASEDVLVFNVPATYAAKHALLRSWRCFVFNEQWREVLIRRMLLRWKALLMMSMIAD